MLVGTAVYGVIKKVLANSTIVQQCISLAGRAIADNRLAGTLGADEELQYLAFCFPDLLGKRGIGIKPRKSLIEFPLPERDHIGGDRQRLVFGVTGENPQRSTMRIQLFNIK